MLIDLKEKFGNRVKVILENGCASHNPQERARYWTIPGKRGLISAWDSQYIEVYVTSMVLAKRMERKGWTVKNHYDDAIAFLVKIDNIDEAFHIIKPRYKRHLSRESLERLKKHGFKKGSGMPFLQESNTQESTLANEKEKNDGNHSRSH